MNSIRKVDNVVVLTGDEHVNHADELHVDGRRPAARPIALGDVVPRDGQGHNPWRRYFDAAEVRGRTDVNKLTTYSTLRTAGGPSNSARASRQFSQTEAQDVRPGRDGDVLLAVDGKRHG